MVGSVCRKGKFHPKLYEYGQIIVDECHHAASETIQRILMEAKAHYVCGVTATPMRGDGKEKINYFFSALFDINILQRTEQKNRE